MVGEVAATRFQLIVGVHDLADPPEARGDELLSWMPFGEVAPLLDRILDNTRATGAVLHVTSDDGFRSDHDLLLPWLLDRGVGATFFVPTGFVDRPGRLSAGQIRELAALGLRIGVHGVRHIDWTAVPEPVFLDDVREGRDRLEQTIGAPIDVVAPPYGRFDGRIVARLFDLGFHEIHTCRPGPAPVGEPLRPRNMLRRETVDAILATSRRPGGLRDVVRCRLRRLRETLRHRTGVA
jgi:peptidoglycan/xylan/chitin deacetylase (PgdA/CDA1 family)